MSSKFENMYENFNICGQLFEEGQQKCPESWSLACYDKLEALYQQTQDCYGNVGIDVFTNFYDLQEKEAKERLEKFVSAVYDNYLFLYEQSKFCNEKNCGISPYLYSEYATTQALKNYIERMLSYVSQQ